MIDLANIGFCGVDCSACADYLEGRCPNCRKSVWPEEPCAPVGCCSEKKIDCCGQCASFPCEGITGFYEESESHRKAYLLMKKIHRNK